MTIKKRKKPSLRDNINHFINQWNEKHPIDLWWRKKYGVSFGSEEHRKQTHIQMFIEYIEDLRLKKTLEIKKEKQNLKQLKIDDKGKEILPMSKKEIEDEFENLDITKY